MTFARQRTTWRALALGALVAAAWAAAAMALVLAGPQPTPRQAVEGALPPSRRALDAAIDRAAQFDAALYRPLAGDRAVMSEYLALPLRVHFTALHRWILLGQDGASRIARASSGYDRETEEITFTPHRGRGTLRMHVRVLWAATPDTYSVEVKIRSLPRALGPARVYLGETPLGAVATARDGTTLRRTFAQRDTWPLRSFRWTVRHAVQAGQSFFLARGDRSRAERLRRFMRSLGFVVDYDITAPIWRRGSEFGDEMPYDFSSEGGSAYHDCDVALPSTPLSYPYRSKVCVARRAYVWSTRFDTLVPAAQAIHVLNRYGDPDRRYRDAPVDIGEPLGLTPLRRTGVARTPRSLAALLERRFRRLGFGMPRCSPEGCDGWASAVRTFQFGALEALLGYRYGDRVSRGYADRVAQIAMQVQIGTDGIVRRAGERPVLRPAQAGSFYLAWNRGFRLSATSGLVSALTRRFDMPPEYRGIIPSNAETSLTGYAFLRLYRCQRFGVGCTGLA